MQRRRIRVTGIVQGVGFRPHVHALATGLGLTGHVGNDDRGVLIEVEGEAGAVARFEQRLRDEPPRLALVEGLRSRRIDPTGDEAFVIVTSRAGGVRDVLVPPDVATCDDCLAEVTDPTDRRFGYAFTNCTNCGPRYSIVRDVPYDRPRTTMADFELCDDCRSEYEDPRDRRFHAQPTCCPACGPRLALLGVDVPSGGPLAGAAALLHRGAVVAIKGLGGFHLAALAHDEDAVASLRRRKHREARPFALMVAGLDAARRLCHVDATEARLLAGIARPIVLLRRRDGAAVAPAVAPGHRCLGLMLPYTPLHHLLLEAVGAPVVLTSGNIAAEPIVHRDADARERLAPITEAMLTHDRPIHVPVEDSVARVVAGEPVVLRRARLDGHPGRCPCPAPCRDPSWPSARS